MNTTIRHYTLNTGHMEISNPEEIDKDIYFTLQAIINHAKVETTDLIDNTCIRIIEEDSGYVCTLYGKHGGDLIQILSTAGTKKTGRTKVYLGSYGGCREVRVLGMPTSPGYRERFPISSI